MTADDIANGFPVILVVEDLFLLNLNYQTGPLK